MSAGTAHASLLTNLETTLRQSKDLFKQLEEQAKTIAQLKAENERLENELSKRPRPLQGSRDGRDGVTTEALLLKDIQSQREIDKLKKKLRAIKAKVQSCGLENMVLSSPLTPAPYISADARAGLPAAQDHKAVIAIKSNEPAKEAHVSGAVVSTNVKSNTPTSETRDASKKKRKLSDMQNAAIASLAEDGDDFGDRPGRSSRSKSFPEARQSYSHGRLDDLLSLPPPNPAILSLQSRTPPASTVRLNPSVNTPEGLPETSIHASNILSKPRQIVRTDPGSKDQTPLASRGRFLRQSSMTRLGTNSTLQGKDNIDSASLSKRKLPCPSGCRSGCCDSRKLRRRSSYLVLPPRYRNMTDYDILCQYLGQGSEEKIQNLTASARENLLHEAKTKIIAEDLGRSDKDGLPRAQSPAGFWDTDWANSQGKEIKGDANA